MKENKCLHKRALVIYRDFLNLSRARSRESLETLSSQSRTKSITKLSSSFERVSKQCSSSPPVHSLDEKFDEMLGIELPETVNGESSSYLEYFSRAWGESSGSSCEIISIFDGASSEDMSIFEKPKETDEGVVTLGAPFNQKLSNTDQSEGCNSILSLGQRDSPWSKVCSKIIPEAKEEECFSWDNSEEKVDLCEEHALKVLGDFPGKDFK